jgi:hypothetical protein
MNYEIIDNFLPIDDFKLIQYGIMESQNLAWYLNNFISGEGDLTTNPKDYYFTHLFYSDYRVRSDNFKIFQPFLEKINCKSLIRIKGNLYPGTDQVQHHKNHQDFDFTHKAALLFINNNNGFTVLNDDVQIESKANRVLLFDPQIPHHSTSCSDEKYRITINFNYF